MTRVFDVITMDHKLLFPTVQEAQEAYEFVCTKEVLDEIDKAIRNKDEYIELDIDTPDFVLKVLAEAQYEIGIESRNSLTGSYEYYVISGWVPKEK